MRPILFHVGEIPVFSYGFALAVAFIVAAVLAIPQARKKGIPAEKVIDLTLYACIAGIIGARLVYVLLEWQTYFVEPFSIFNLKDGGLSFYGGFIAAFLVGVWYCRRQKISPWTMADIAAPLIALGYSIVRIGCLLNGCCYGIPTKVAWALPAAANDTTLRHPTQLYAAGLSFVLFLVLTWLQDRKKFDGHVMLLYVGLYSVLRFIVEIFRDTPRFIGPLSLAQVVSVITFAGAFACIAVLSRVEEGRPVRG